jgi:predicted nuclease of predicted toxin-antitoxin system
MKLLFDQNISYRITRLLSSTFANSLHVSSVGLSNCNDSFIWQFAYLNNYTIVTFDADFYDLSILKGFPPKIIWLRTGNLITVKIIERLILNHSIIVSFIDNPNQGCLEIY